MTRKHTGSILITVLLLLSILLPGATALAEEQVTLAVWGAIPPENGPADVVAAFEAKYPNIKVEYTRYVNDENGNLKLDIALMADDEIDVFYSYNDVGFAKRVSSGLTLELSELMEKNGFSPEANYASYPVYDGKVYCLPTTVTARFIYVNMDMLAAAGLDLPEAWTVEEYTEAMRKLTKTEGGLKTFGGFWDWTNSCLNMFHVQTLGDNAFYNIADDGTVASNFDHPIFKQSIDIFKQIMVDEKVQPSIIEIETSKLTPSGEFLTGKVATFAESASHLRNINNTEQYPHDFVTGFAPFPTMTEDAQEYTWKGYFSDVISISSNSKNMDAAWKFVEFMGTEGQRLMYGAGKYPSWNGITKEEIIQGLLGENPQERYDLESFERVVINNDKKYYNNTEFAAFSQITTIWKEEVQKVLGGEQTSEQAVENAKTRADAEILKSLSE